MEIPRVLLHFLRLFQQLLKVRIVQRVILCAKKLRNKETDYEDGKTKQTNSETHHIRPTSVLRFVQFKSGADFAPTFSGCKLE